MPCKSVLNFHFQFLWFLRLFLCLPEHLAIFQEKIKEKESRKTQTFKKDEDKKKKLMQSEVQVSYYLLLVWEPYHTKQLFILFLEVALQSALVKESVSASKKRTFPFSLQRSPGGVDTYRSWAFLRDSL